MEKQRNVVLLAMNNSTAQNFILLLSPSNKYKGLYQVRKHGICIFLLGLSPLYQLELKGWQPIVCQVNSRSLLQGKVLYRYD